MCWLCYEPKLFVMIIPISIAKYCICTESEIQIKKKLAQNKRKTFQFSLFLRQIQTIWLINCHIWRTLNWSIFHQVEMVPPYIQWDNISAFFPSGHIKWKGFLSRFWSPGEIWKRGLSFYSFQKRKWERKAIKGDNC